MSKKIQLKVAGNLLTLSPNDFVASGGEGSIYRQGNLTYKVYNPGKTGLNSMEQKVKLLSAIKHKGIIAPVDTLFDKQDNVVGFSMPWVDGEVLVRYFNNEFRKRVGYGIKETIQSAYEMREIVEAAHAGHALMVDGNEMNYIVSPERVCIIDVDSWQIGTFKATAIMASIRDYHTQSFNELSDWFSWAVVSFQLFVGIHPYRGRHPKYKPGDFVDRMKDGVSVFNKDVFLPSTVRDLGDVPAGLLEWYESVFETNQRTPPPAIFEKQAAQKVVQRTVYSKMPSAGGLVYTRLKDYPDLITDVFPNGTVITQKRVFTKTARLGIELERLFGPSNWGTFQYHCISTDDGVVLIRDDEMRQLCLINGDDFVQLSFQDLLIPHKWMSGSNRLFALRDEGFTEVKIGSMAVNGKGNSYYYLGNTWNVSPKSTYVGNGLAVYNALGTPFIVLPFEKKGCLIEKEEHLRGHKLIAAKAVNNFATCLVKDNRGQNFKLEVLYPGSAASWSTPLVWIGPTDETGLNFAMNHRGIIATIVDDGELVLFSPYSGQSKRISDKNIKAAMTLCPVDDNIGYIKDNELWSISTT